MIFNSKGSGKKSLFKKILTTIMAIFLGILFLGIYENSKEKSNNDELANKEVNELTTDENSEDNNDSEKNEISEEISNAEEAENTQANTEENNQEAPVNNGTVDITKNKVDKPKEKKSEYTERDKPWGEFNYKDVGIIKELEKDIDNNFITAILVTDDKKKNKIKIYGTDMNIRKYKSKRVFLVGTKKSSIDKDFILVSNYKRIDLVDENLIKSIDNLQSHSKSKDDMTKIEKEINKIRHDEYKKYMKNYYDSKVASLK